MKQFKQWLLGHPKAMIILFMILFSILVVVSARNNKPCKKVWQITKVEKDIDANEDRERLDVGKIRALKKANWTVQAVADDMGLSITTVAQIYYSI